MGISGPIFIGEELLFLNKLLQKSAGEIPVRTEIDGIILGKSNLPLVNEGDTLFHIACFERIEFVESQLEEFMGMKPSPGDLYGISESTSDSEKH